jgi:hypothetical protein
VTTGTQATEDRPSLGWVALGALAVGLALWLSPVNERWSVPLTDWQARAAARHAPTAGVVVIDIDDASLRELQPRLGAWPYPRDVHALAIEHLRAAGATAIALDLLLSEPGSADRALAQALRRPGAPVVLAAAGLREPLLTGGARSDRPAPLRRADAGAQVQAWPELALPARGLWPQRDSAPRVGSSAARSTPTAACAGCRCGTRRRGGAGRRSRSRSGRPRTATGCRCRGAPTRPARSSCRCRGPRPR